MPPYTTLLEEALEAWADVRAGLIDEVENIPEEQFGFRPTPANRSVAELVRHVIENGLMMVGELARPDGDFCRAEYGELIEEHSRGVRWARSKAGLVALLRSTHAEGERKLREAGELHMLQYIRRFDGLPGTRLAWLHHGIAHESYHTGQLALYARLLGLVPALTQKIMGG